MSQSNIQVVVLQDFKLNFKPNKDSRPLTLYECSVSYLLSFRWRKSSKWKLGYMFVCFLNFIHIIYAAQLLYIVSLIHFFKNITPSLVLTLSTLLTNIRIFIWSEHWVLCWSEYLSTQRLQCDCGAAGGQSVWGVNGTRPLKTGAEESRQIPQPQRSVRELLQLHPRFLPRRQALIVVLEQQGGQEDERLQNHVSLLVLDQLVGQFNHNLVDILARPLWNMSEKQNKKKKTNIQTGSNHWTDIVIVTIFLHLSFINFSNRCSIFFKTLFHFNPTLAWGWTGCVWLDPQTVSWQTQVDQSKHGCCRSLHWGPSWL